MFLTLADYSLHDCSITTSLFNKTNQIFHSRRRYFVIRCSIVSFMILHQSHSLRNCSQIENSLSNTISFFRKHSCFRRSHCFEVLWAKRRFANFELSKMYVKWFKRDVDIQTSAQRYRKLNENNDLKRNRMKCKQWRKWEEKQWY